MALSTVWMFIGEQNFFYSHVDHDKNTAKNMALVRNLSAERGFLFHSKARRADGSVSYRLYNRFPIGVFVLTKLAVAPFEGDFSAQLAAARTAMLAFLCAAAVLAYLGLARLIGSRAVALGATLLGFSSYHLLLYGNAVSNEMSPDLFAVMLVFHGVVLFEIEGGRRRFWELAARVCVALLLGWHVYGLLLPYLAFVAAREAAAAWDTGEGGAANAARRLAAAVAGVLRGRAVMLGALALLLGAGMLGYNLAREHAALDGRRAVAELPSARSMLLRTGLGETRYADAEERQLPAFLRLQFHRVGAVSVPFAFSGGADLDEFAWRDSEAPMLFWIGVIATVGTLAGFAVFRGPKGPLAALALTGFVWALLVPHNVAWVSHQYETMFHVGVPLCLFAALLIVMRRLWRPAPGVCAALAVVVFAASNMALGLRHRDAGEAGAERAQMAEFEAAAKTIGGGSVWVHAHSQALNRFVNQRRFLNFYMAGNFLHIDRLDLFDDKAISAVDFVLAFERYDIPALLTPEHGSVFLYRAGAEAGAVLAAMRQEQREEHRRLRTLTPVARTTWDIHVVPAIGQAGDTRRGAELAYFKAPCSLDDTRGMFRLRVTALGGKAPWGQARQLERRFFFFHEHGTMMDDKCVMRVPLPAWPAAAAYADQLRPDGDVASWRVVFQLDIDRLRDAFGALPDETPAARGAFDVYLRDGVLRYVRAPCAAADVRRRFFLHLVPAGRQGFDNRDFEFGEHGALFDGACLAMLTLPDYDIGRVRTGQVDADAGGEAWRVELAGDAVAAGR